MRLLKGFEVDKQTVSKKHYSVCCIDTPNDFVLLKLCHLGHLAKSIIAPKGINIPHV